MTRRRRASLTDAVVVVTGASSGVGLATAQAFADCGARLVLVARTTDALERVADRCRARGSIVSVVTTDIRDPSQVEALRKRAVAEHGRIDVWVSCAAALLAAPFGDESSDELVRLLDTNVTGAALCARTALTQFRRQGHGVLIDVSSLLGIVPNPLVPTYVMSKFAVRGLSLSLHHLVAAWPGIDVCVVMPGPIDTPMFERAANHTGRRLRAIPPAIAPERVAGRIVRCAYRPKRQVTVGITGHAVLVAHRLVPRATEWVVARAAAALLVRPETAPSTTGALFSAHADARVTGNWRRGERRRALGARLGWLAGQQGAAT